MSPGKLIVLGYNCALLVLAAYAWARVARTPARTVPDRLEQEFNAGVWRMHAEARALLEDD